MNQSIPVLTYQSDLYEMFNHQPVMKNHINSQRVKLEFYLTIVNTFRKCRSVACRSKITFQKKE